MSSDSGIDKRILEHIFTVSPTMIGVCIGLITLLKVTSIGLASYADELLSVDALVFMCACMFSFFSLKNRKRIWFEFAADVLFFLAMLFLIIAGVMIVFVECHNNGGNALFCPTPK
jgi:hypothetical protein